MYGLCHENPGLRVLVFFVGYGLSNRVVGGHTCRGNFKHYNIIPGFLIWSFCCNNILNMTRLLSLGFMHRFGFKLIYGEQKRVLRPSFDQIIIFTWDLLLIVTG